MLWKFGLLRIEVENGFCVVSGEIGVLVLHVADELGGASCVDCVVGAL